MGPLPVSAVGVFVQALPVTPMPLLLPPALLLILPKWLFARSELLPNWPCRFGLPADGDTLDNLPLDSLFAAAAAAAANPPQQSSEAIEARCWSGERDPSPAPRGVAK